MKEKKQRKKRSEADDLDPSKGGQGQEEDNIFVKMWKTMVQAAKNVAEKITQEVKSWNQNQTNPNTEQPNY
jgi:hypothetical protein